MFQPYQLFVGLRYTRAKRRNHFISFISLISILGIALGVTALITVTSVMNGFEKEMRERIIGAASHATITQYGDPLDSWEALADTALEHENVEGAAPYIEGQVMLVHNGRSSGALFRGVLPEKEPDVSDLAFKLLDGVDLEESLVAGEFGILLGSDLANTVGATVGDKVTVITPEASVTPVGFVPRLKRFTVTGIFKFGMFQYDSAMSIVHSSDASKLLKLDEGFSGVRLKLDDTSISPFVVNDLRQKLGFDFFISDWTMQNANYFAAVRLEKTMMFIILSMIVAVAAFNIVSTLVMMVQDKQSDIAIMRTQGASPKSIMSIFLVQGTLIGVLGTIAGTIGGVLLASNIDVVVPFIEQFIGPVLDPSVYYIDKMPSDLRGSVVIKTVLMSLTLSILATLYPAWRAARTEPAAALAYE